MKRENAIVIGMDSETLQGPPITLQFYSEEAPRINGCVFLGRKPAMTTFLAQLKKLRPGFYRMYGHNLEFDMLSVLWEARAKIRDGNIDLKAGDWTITGRYSKPVFALFSDGERRVELVDSILWFQTSLERAAELVCPHLPKLIRPEGLGIKEFTAKDTRFVQYAMRDAEVAYYLGLAIERFHAELEIPAQISLASMAAAVFRTRYMRSDMYQPPLYEWMVGAAASYHGGVNRVRPGAAPGWHLGVTALDLSSAYPHAMSLLPDFSTPAGYRTLRVRSIRNIKVVPEVGIYKISGKAVSCDWPALFDHNFEPLTSEFGDIWVTGFELNEALASGEVKLSALKGYYYEAPSGYSPFARYVGDFYRLKSEATDSTMRYMYKIILNALSGKFIQTSPDYTLVDGQLVKIKRAGGLYHPFVASLITGHTRSRMHQVEHKYKALHTATDGIFAPGRHKGEAKKELGALIAEGYGDLALFRNKLYILYSREPVDGAYPSQTFSDRYILKCARHGFQGRVADLERMLISEDRTYKVNKPLKLKTALRNRDVPNKFVTTVRKLNIGKEFKVYRHG